MLFLFRTLLIAFFLCFFGRTVSAQNCNCTDNFDFFVEKIKLNYSGFRDKVTDQNRAAYEEHCSTFRAVSAMATSDTACLRILRDWAKWHRDGHVQISINVPNTSPDSIRAQFAGSERIAMDERAAHAYLDQPGRQPVEGIWRNAEGNYRVAIVAQPDPKRDFAAVILKADSIYWIPGQVKFELKGEAGSQQFNIQYYMRDHTAQPEVATLQPSGVLQLAKLGNWYREYPNPSTEKPAEEAIFTFRMLDSTTALITRTYYGRIGAPATRPTHG
jgi:hypothetical protein